MPPSGSGLDPRRPRPSWHPPISPHRTPSRAGALRTGHTLRAWEPQSPSEIGVGRGTPSPPEGTEKASSPPEGDLASAPKPDRTQSDPGDGKVLGGKIIQSVSTINTRHWAGAGGELLCADSAPTPQATTTTHAHTPGCPPPYTRTHTHAHTTTRTHISTHIYGHNHIHAHTCAYTCVHNYTLAHTYAHTHMNICGDINAQTHRAFYYGVCASPKAPGRGNGKNQGENYMRQRLAPKEKAMECSPSSLGYFL